MKEQKENLPLSVPERNLWNCWPSFGYRTLDRIMSWFVTFKEIYKHNDAVKDKEHWYW